MWKEHLTAVKNRAWVVFLTSIGILECMRNDKGEIRTPTEICWEFTFCQRSVGTGSCYEIPSAWMLTNNVLDSKWGLEVFVVSLLSGVLNDECIAAYRKELRQRQQSEVKLLYLRVEVMSLLRGSLVRILLGLPWNQTMLLQTVGTYEGVNKLSCSWKVGEWIPPLALRISLFLFLEDSSILFSKVTRLFCRSGLYQLTKWSMFCNWTNEMMHK